MTDDDVPHELGREELLDTWGRFVDDDIDLFEMAAVFLAMVEEIEALSSIVQIAVWPDDVVVGEDGRTLLDGRFPQHLLEEFGYPVGGWVPLRPDHIGALTRALEATAS